MAFPASPRRRSGTDGRDTRGPVRLQRGNGTETIAFKGLIDRLANGLPVRLSLDVLLLQRSQFAFRDTHKGFESGLGPPSA